MTSANCSRYWHVLDFDASTAKFTIHHHKLATSLVSPAKNFIVDPKCNCSTNSYAITRDDVKQSAARISETAKNLMIDKLCVNEMKKIYSHTSKGLLLANTRSDEDRYSIRGQMSTDRESPLAAQSY